MGTMQGECSPQMPSEGSVSAEDVFYEGVPARLWRLLAWCLERDLTRRPGSVEAVLKSGLLRFDDFLASPKTAGATGKKEKKEKRADQRTSIDDLLRLKNR